MKGRLLFVNVTLLVLIFVCSSQLRARYDHAKEREAAILRQGVPKIPAPAITPILPPDSAKATSYIDVAQKLVFSRDRNPNVIIDPVIPPPPPPPKIMPELPRAHGVMAFGGTPTVLLSEKPGAAHKAYRPGDKIGEFTLLAVNNSQILFEWDGLRVLRNLEDITDKDGAGATASAPSTPVTQNETATTTVVTRPPVSTDAAPGADIGNDVRSCNAGDTSPAGTVVGGYRKVLTPTPFGALCRWDPVRP